MTMRALAFRAFFVTSLLMGQWAAFPAQAQDYDQRALAQRIERLERDLQTLRGQAFRGSGSGGSAGAGVATSGESIARLSERLDVIEENMRKLTGQIEEQGYQNDQISQKLDRFIGDAEFRFKTLEGGHGGAQAGAGGPPATDDPAAETAPAAPKSTASAATGGSAGQGSLAPGAGTLGTISGSAMQGTTPPPAADAPKPGKQAAAAAGATLPKGNPADQYNYAFGLIRRGDYESAEKAMAEFVATHPKSDLAGNAQYWLGETFYVRGDIKSAAQSFLVALQKYPNSPKGADNMLKLGLSLAQLKQKEEACLTLKAVPEKYPQASAAIKNRARSEAQRLKCR